MRVTGLFERMVCSSDEHGVGFKRDGHIRLSALVSPDVELKIDIRAILLCQVLLLREPFVEVAEVANDGVYMDNPGIVRGNVDRIHFFDLM
jgi:hypothetical protein